VSVRVVECVALGAVPVTVIVYVPVAVLFPVVTVIVDDPPAVTEIVLNETDAPAGPPLAESDTVCAGPLVTAVEIIDVLLPPCDTLRLDGLAEIEKSLVTGGEVTVSVTVVEWVALGLVPVTVIVYVPNAVAELTETVIVVDPPAVTDGGVKETVVPVG
jgi:hypothetical protein